MRSTLNAVVLQLVLLSVSPVQQPTLGQAEGRLAPPTSVVGPDRKLDTPTVYHAGPGLDAEVYPVELVSAPGKVVDHVAVDIPYGQVVSLPNADELKIEVEQHPPLQPHDPLDKASKRVYFPVWPLHLWSTEDAACTMMMMQYWQQQGLGSYGFVLKPSSKPGDVPLPVESDDAAARNEQKDLGDTICTCSFSEAVAKFARIHGKFVLAALRPRVCDHPLTWSQYCTLMDDQEPALITIEGGGMKRSWVACGYETGPKGRYMILQEPIPRYGKIPADPAKTVAEIRWDGGYSQLTMLSLSPPAPL